ncbi:biopolymer transporter ExbD [Pelomonas sp. V22]|uniref:ExbD/TolR family protein n=1 Tax=Pelomonas sp. V22 TaxID=2822139 RepID=UPI0024A92812|nr:biopolymer transporter ExbD [Pelomonas sp. V22]MDI4632055.1 biopolymer transporter ExbD [Pelomonas sp. V22]
MGMNVGSSSGSDEPEVMMDVNTTPLIDVMLVLLVMLIITIPIQLHSVNLDMPPPNNQTPPKEPTVVELFIDFDGVVSWNGVPVASMAELDSRLGEQAQMAVADQAEIHIKPNKLVEYGVVAAVMASVQRHGLTKMGMVGNEQFAK